MDIKFTGDFKKLIPMGFKFYKLYANNYKVYEKNKVWIWVAHGGYVEISDHFSKSGFIAKKILDGTYPVYDEDKVSLTFKIEKGKPKSCVMDQETGDIIDYRVFLHSLPRKEIEPGVYDMDYDHDRFPNIYLRRSTMETIKEISEMIEIIEKEK